MTEELWTEDEWDDEEAQSSASESSPKPRKRGLRWRPFAFGAAGAAALLVGVALLGGGGGGERPLSHETPAVYAPGPGAVWSDAAPSEPAPTPTRFAMEPFPSTPIYPPPFADQAPAKFGVQIGGWGDALETGDIAPPSGFGSGFSPSGLGANAAPSFPPPPSLDLAEVGPNGVPPDAPTPNALTPDALAGAAPLAPVLVEEAGLTTDLAAVAPPAHGVAPRVGAGFGGGFGAGAAPGLGAPDLGPPEVFGSDEPPSADPAPSPAAARADPAPTVDFPAPIPRPEARSSVQAAAPAPAASEAPAIQPATPEAPRLGAPMESPQPRAKPARPVHKTEAAAPDPFVYTPPKSSAASAGGAEPAALAAKAALGRGWSARLKLETPPEAARVEAVALSPPVYDPKPAPQPAAPRAEAQAAAVAPKPPIHDPAASGGSAGAEPSIPLMAASAADAPIHDPAAPKPAKIAAETPAEIAAEAPAQTPAAPKASAMRSAAVEFGPALSAEDFAALDLSAAALETGELPKVRAAPIDGPEDGPFSARAAAMEAAASAASSAASSSAAPARRPAPKGPVLPPDAPRAMVVLTALGLHEAVTLRAMRDAPNEVALAFAPIGRRVDSRVADLRAAGRVVLIEAPMEAMSRASTPENLTLATEVSAEENQARLARVLAAAPRASGISTYMGARFTADSTALAGVLPMLAERGLFVMENQPTNRSLLQGEARRAGVRYAAAPFTLDRAADAASIRTALAQLERRALADGEAVGVMAASNAALDALALWAEELAARGVRLAPLSEALE